jgi:hypothetical protein
MERYDATARGFASKIGETVWVPHSEAVEAVEAARRQGAQVMQADILERLNELANDPHAPPGLAFLLAPVLAHVASVKVRP